MPTRAIKVWNQSASAWENVGIEAPVGGLDAATASATYLRQDTASATYLTNTTASVNYLRRDTASATYLTNTTASVNYLRRDTASATYLRTDIASATYLPISASSTLGGSSASMTNGIITTSLLVAPEERFNVISGSATGTINLDTMTSTAWLYTNTGNTNFTVNVRGNASNSLNSILNTGDAITVGLVNATGTTASQFFATTIQVDGATITPKWLNSSSPPSSTPLQSTTGFDSYTITFVKTASAVYTALGSWGQFR